MNLNDPHADGLLLRAGARVDAADRLMILLHGRGATADDILTLGPEIASAATTAFLAPQAAGRTWYPNSFLAPIADNEPFLSSAIARVAALVEESGIPAERIVLCGFSQGACLSTEFVARHPRRYAGVIAFTGGLIGPPGHDLHHPGSLAGTPVLLSSGDPDPHVPFARVEETARELRKMDAQVQVLRHPGRPHTVLQQEIAAARELVFS